MNVIYFISFSNYVAIYTCSKHLYYSSMQIVPRACTSVLSLLHERYPGLQRMLGE